jgi:hypothetical protein
VGPTWFKKGSNRFKYVSNDFKSNQTSFDPTSASPRSNFLK